MPPSPTTDLPNGATPAPAPALAGVCQPAGDGLFRLPDVTIWSDGWHRDNGGNWKFYSAAENQQIAANWSALRESADPHLEPPTALGHEEEQARLKALLRDDAAFQRYVAEAAKSNIKLPHCRWTDCPAAGWPERVRYDGGRIVADLERIPPVVAEMIDRGELRHVSPELYDNFSYRGKDYGPVMRRVSLLGNHPPGNKSLPSLGQRAFSDAYGAYVQFADAPAADAPAQDGKAAKRDEQITKLQSWGLSAKAVQIAAGSMSAANFADFYTAVAECMADSAAGVNDMSKPNDPNTPANGGAAGQGQPMRGYSDTPSPEFIAAVAEGVKVQLGGWFEEQRKALGQTADEVKKTGDELKQFSDAARRDAAERSAAEKKGRVDAFLTLKAKEGKVQPWETDEGDPKTAHLSLRRRLYAADGVNQISCYSDGGTEVKKTQLDIEMDAIEARPARAFNDRIGGQSGGATDQKDAVRAEVKQWFGKKYGTTNKG